MLKKCSIPSSATIRSASSISAGSSSVTKYIASPARIASRVFGWPSTTSRAVGDPVDRPLAARRELHHEQLGAALGGQQLDRLLEPHRHRAGPLVQQLVRAVDGRVEDAEAARAGREHRLEADRAVRVAELARRGLDLGARRCTRRNSGAGTPSRCRSAYVSALSFERRIASGGETSTGIGEAVAVLGQPLEVERRLRQDGVDALALDDLEDRVREAGVGAGRHEVERVAEVPADRALGHVRADEAHLALAVLAQRAQERGGAGRARGG